MPRRLPMVLPLTLAALAGLLAFTPGAPAQPSAAPPPAAGDDTSAALKRQQEQNAKLYKDFAQALLRLAQRYEKSDRPEDQNRAKTIRAALDLGDKVGVENQFQKMIVNLAKSKNPTSADFNVLAGQDQELRQALQDILAILMTDDETEALRRQIATLTEYKKRIEAVKRAEELIRARTESGRGDKDRLAKEQQDLAQRTREIAAEMAGKKPDSGKKNDPNGNGGKGQQDTKAEPKGEGKPSEKSAEAKADTGEAKSDGKDPKAGDGPEAAGKSGSESKAGGDGPMKPGAGSGKDGPKAGEGDPKDAAGSGKDGGEPKDGGAGKEPMPNGVGDPKDPMPSGDPKDPKGSGQPGADAKAGKPGESKAQGEGKAGGKPSKGQAGEGKPAGDGKGSDAPPSQGKGGGQPKPGGGSSSSGGPSPPSPPKPGQEQIPGRKEVEEAYPHQESAVPDIQAKRNDAASKKEDEAIRKLEAAIKELEKRLKQLREEEMLKKLANLEARCNNMLRMQMDVLANTEAIHRGIIKNNNEKTPADRQKSQVQSDKEGEIVAEADKALKLLEGEGTAVAFAGVLAEVRNDMLAVKTRLLATYVDVDTQQIEKDIIDQLKEMILALKKAQQDIQSKPGEPKEGGKPPPQKLIDMLAELKLIRSLQMNTVNKRTTSYAERYKGEQANDPIIQAELRQLSERQAKIQDMLHKIATGMNQ